MDAKFWISAWEEGRTGFHQGHYHEKLVQFFPGLHPKAGQKVLVPLCGKTKDLIWLKEQGLQVHGVELAEQAVTEFFQENQFPVATSKSGPFTNYTSDAITISCGDFFKLDRNETYDLVYDRASLVALPEEMRKDYAQVITDALKPQGQYLLIVYEYEQSKMAGPPFSISDQEVKDLYSKRFKIQLLEDQDCTEQGPKFSTLNYLKHKTYLLEKL